MKKLISTVLAMLVSTSIMAIVAPGEYYVQNDYFGKMLGLNAEGGIYLMPYDRSNDSNYIFEAVAGDAGYVKLRHKATGKYLAASTKNTWSVEMTTDGSGDQCLWSLDARFSTGIVSKKNTARRLGCDFSSESTKRETNVPIYYDKNVGGLNWFTVIPANGNGFEASLAAYQTEPYANEYGVAQQDAYQVSSEIEVRSEDFHIVSANPFATGGSVNLSGEQAWLVFDSIRPSKVISSYLDKVKINGSNAVNGTNCRVEIWLTGAAVIPCTPTETPFVGYSTMGSSCELAVKNNATLGDFDNEMHSFTLKRGYMATIATGKNGEGYSRVYVADHGDLSVTLPTALDKRVSSVNIRKWHYTSKRGYADGDKGKNLACNSSWHWNWDANLNTSADMEYIPIKQHRYWPSNENINKQNSTAMMLINEPEHSEQHTSSKCSCGGTTDEWTAYTITKQFNYTGMRIGSPSATDFGWLKNYTDHCNNMAQRCDFVATHGYWSSNWANNINTLWNNSKRPIWITEWEYGSSWDSYQPKSEEEYAKHLLDVLDILEYDNRVERYSYYGVDGGGGTGWQRWLFYEMNPSKGCTQAGNVYKKVKTHFAYSASRQAVPNWWEPAVQVPSIKSVTVLPDGDYSINIVNDNGDATESVTLQMQNESGSWTDIQSVYKRSLFESKDIELTVSQSEMPEQCVLRAVVNTIYGKSTQSEEYDFGLLELTKEFMTFSFDDGPFLTQGVVTYAKDISAECPLANMQPVAGWEIPENGDARATGLWAWGQAGLGGMEYAMPATNSEGTSAGGGLGIVAVWMAKAQYTYPVTIPAGKYIITVPVYNIGNGTDFEKNLIGFVADDGTEYLATRTSYPKGVWTTESIRLVFDAPVSGYLSLGVTAKNAGSGSSPHLAIDYMAIKGGSDEPDDNPIVGITDVATLKSQNAKVYTLSGVPVRVDNVIVPGLYIIKTDSATRKALIR